MHPARGSLRLVSPFAIALMAGVVWVPKAAQASAPTSQGASAPSGSDSAGAKKKAHKPSGKPGGKPAGQKSSPKSKAAPDATLTRSKSTRLARQRSGHAQSGMINDDVTLIQFPSQAGAAKKAFAQNRRDQLGDAEKASRGPDQRDRWQTVLFHLRDLDARNDSEACFWRLVAYYRLGQLERARLLRSRCELAPRDAAVTQVEDEQAARLQPAGTLAEKEPTPVENPAPYAGDGPEKVDR